jgi:hypothetical protein
MPAPQGHKPLRRYTLHHAHTFQCAALVAENSILNLSRSVLSENVLESCNAIASAGFRNEAIMKGFYASTGNGNKYPNTIATMVDEALS